MELAAADPLKEASHQFINMTNILTHTHIYTVYILFFSVRCIINTIDMTEHILVQISSVVNGSVHQQTVFLMLTKIIYIFP